jgi:hypothetical protein
MCSILPIVMKTNNLMSKPVLHTRSEWKEMGFRVPSKAQPATKEIYFVPGYRTVMRERHLFSQEQVVAINANEAKRRSEAARKAVATRIEHMEQAIEEAELTIVARKSNEEIYELAIHSHGGNYQGDPGEFRWSNRKARDTIRHRLTNYESLWGLINRGPTAEFAYQILRDRVDALVAETYPQFAEGAEEVEVMPRFGPPLKF